ncbi:MAG: hypothetical protein IIX80_03625 [Clostridia bacterium]|nr:hypothetical protein [Clostridia bacterium]
MNYKPNPLLYGANEDFLSSFKLVITMRSAIDYKALSQAVAAAMVRYPYFSVTPVQEGNSIVLRHNERPVAVFDDGRCPVLGSEACNGHLLAFGCEGRRSFCIAATILPMAWALIPCSKRCSIFTFLRFTAPKA